MRLSWKLDIFTEQNHKSKYCLINVMKTLIGVNCYYSLTVPSYDSKVRLGGIHKGWQG
jgi:hypothetical protein